MPNRGRVTRRAIALASVVLAAGCTASGGGSSGEFRAAPHATQPVAGLGQSASPQATGSPQAPGAPAASGVAVSPDGSAGDPLPIRSIAPAAAAGGMCTKLDFASVQREIHTQFAVAVATGTPGREQVCVLQQSGGDADLTLSSAPTAIDAESFKLDYQPSNAKAITGLGLAAYSQLTPGGQGSGPSAEVGWLTKSALLTLTFQTAPGSTPSLASAALPGLVELARATAAR